MKKGGSQGKGQIRSVAYWASLSVVLKWPTLSNGRLAIISISERKNDYRKTGRREVDSLAYLRSKTVQTMGVSSR
jgi:hypothetical protein